MILALEADGLRLGLLPDLGGSIAWLDWRRPEGRVVPLLRHADPAAIASGNPSRLACFPLIPFANRIAGSRFTHQGREYVLPVNRPPNPTAIHGFSFQAPWQVAERSAAAARLVHRHRASGTPFRYTAEQTFSLEPGCLRVALTVTHEGEVSLPYGVGLHPWFPRGPDTRLALEADTIFPPDEHLLPTGPCPLPPETGLARGRTAAELVPLDACLAGWDGRATITWPSQGYGLEIVAGEPFRAVHVFVPADRPTLCVEPVSHVPDVHNHPEWAGFGPLRVLAPGETLAGEVSFRVRPG